MKKAHKKYHKKPRSKEQLCRQMLNTLKEKRGRMSKSELYGVMNLNYKWGEIVLKVLLDNRHVRLFRDDIFVTASGRTFLYNLDEVELGLTQGATVEGFKT